MAMTYYIVPRDKVGMALGIWGIAAMVAPVIYLRLAGTWLIISAGSGFSLLTSPSG